MKNRTKNKSIIWWGCLHINGDIQVKRYSNELDITEARESPFCQEVFGPFISKNRDDALRVLKMNL